MPLGLQIAIGSVLLGVCALAHVSVLVSGIYVIDWVAGHLLALAKVTRWGGIILTGFGVVLVGHTIQIWTWAMVLRRVGAIHSIEAAVYYTLVTSTTLGYGDITLDRRWRILGAMAAVTGLLIFGLSTAFLIELMSGLVTELPKPDVVKAM